MQRFSHKACSVLEKKIFNSFSHTNTLAGIIFWRDFAIFSHFFARNRMKIPGVRKKSHAEFFSFCAVKFLFAHAAHFETIGLLCLTGFWIIVAPKFITHRTAGNHSLICIIEKLYRKSSLSVSSLSKRFLSQPRVSKNMSADLEKIKEKIIRPKAVQSGWQHVKLSCSSTTQLDWSGHALLPWFGWQSNTRQSWAWITNPLPSSWSPYSAVCILLRARCNDKKMKAKPATSVPFKIMSQNASEIFQKNFWIQSFELQNFSDPTI